MSDIISQHPAPLLHACRLALAAGFASSSPTVLLNSAGRVSEVSENCVEGVQLADFKADLDQGAGKELDGKFLSAHSSCALAVNTFAPFKSRPNDLRLPIGGDFTSLRFERKFHLGLAGGPANLDVVAEGPDCLLAVESKCLEPLNEREAKFAPAYFTRIRDERCDTGWFQEMLRLGQQPTKYRWLDAAQLVKHGLGISYTIKDRPAALLYLYWEPVNHETFPFFEEHRSEVQTFATAIGDRGGPTFAAMSYLQLWDWWSEPNRPKWLQSHVARLRRRYAVAVI